MTLAPSSHPSLLAAQSPQRWFAIVLRSPRLRRRHLLWLAIALLTFPLLAFVVPCVLVVRAVTEPKRLAPSSSPKDLGLAYEDVAFPSAGDCLTLRGWWMPGAGPQTVILIHGKDSVRDDPGLGFLALTAGLVAAGYNVLAFDLRGHGASEAGHLTLGPLETRDVRGAIAYVRRRGIPPGQIALLGFSTGGAAALSAAVLDPAVGATIADGVWPDLRALLGAQITKQSPLPAFYTPGVVRVVHLLYGVDVAAAKPVADVATLSARRHPLLLIHEAEDAYTSPAQARQLDHAAARNPRASSWMVEDAPHVKAYVLHPEEYLARLLAFLANAIGFPRPRIPPAAPGS